MNSGSHPLPSLDKAWESAKFVSELKRKNGRGQSLKWLRLITVRADYGSGLLDVPEIAFLSGQLDPCAFELLLHLGYFGGFDVGWRGLGELGN